LASALPFRIVVAAAVVLLHLWAMTHLARERLGTPFNASPGNPPGFVGGRPDGGIDRWNRLVISRWDAAHYMGLGMRGYKFCKNASELRPGEFPDSNPACQLHFYPGYGFLGRAVAEVLRIPIDFALLGVSIAASIALTLMWTGREMRAGLGVGGAYLSLLLLNVWTAGYLQVTIETEPCLMAMSMGTFVCLQRRWDFPAAFLAGAASIIRITGVGAGFAVCAVVLARTLRRHPRPSLAWLRALALMAIAGWGAIALMTYFGVRFGDPFAYGHSYEREYHHGASFKHLLFLDGRVFIQSIWAEPNDGVFLAATLLWFALGHREGLKRFDFDGQVFWYVLYFSLVLIGAAGSVDNAFGGAARYMITALPLFFAMAGVMRNKPAVLGLWLLMSTTHYYNAGICTYESQFYPNRAQQCGFARNFRTDELQHEREREKH
jgi:hypothetical protein